MRIKTYLYIISAIFVWLGVAWMDSRVLTLPLLLLLDTVLLLRACSGAIEIEIDTPSTATSDPLHSATESFFDQSITNSEQDSETSACASTSGPTPTTSTTSTSSHQRAPSSPTQSWQPQTVPDWITASEAEALRTGTHAGEVLATAGAAATTVGLTASLYLREDRHCKDTLLRRLALKAAASVGVSVAFVEPAVLTR